MVDWKNVGTVVLVVFDVLILILLFAFFNYKARKKMAEADQRLKAREEYIKNMETVMDIIRREKHDFNNHLNILLSMCLLRKPDTLEKIESYLKKLTNNERPAYRFFDSGNDYIDGLLLLKSNVAYEYGINMEADFEAPLNEIPVDDNHLTSIMGNIIDNAFEAVLEDKSGKPKVVSILAYAEEGRYCISISNNGPMISQECLEKIFENGYSTKCGDKNRRGFGLYIAKQLIRKNGGEISVLSSEEETEFLISFQK